MSFFDRLLGLPPNQDNINGLGRPSLRLEFQNNNDLFSFLEKNPKARDFVKLETAKPKIVNPKPAPKPIELQVEVTPESEREFADVVLIPLDQVFTDHQNFQNRDSDFSKESVSRIIEAITNGTFVWAAFDPITIWKNPEDKKFYILSGHSRTESFRLAFSEGLQSQGRTFEKIPAKLFTGTLEEARTLARTSNNLSTRETDLERAKYYRTQREQGAPAKVVVEEAKKLEGKNATFIINLSYLNPTGKTWDSLVLLGNQPESENTRAIKDIADWLGEIRRKLPELTASHENEIYDWLMEGNYRNLKNKRNFIDRVSIVVERRKEFGILADRLNLNNAVGKSPGEMDFDEQVDSARSEYNEAEKILKEKRKEFISRDAKGEELKNLLIQYEADVNNTLSRLNKPVATRDQVKQGARNQMALFGVSLPPAFSATQVNLPDGIYEGTYHGYTATVNGVVFKTVYGIKTHIPQPIKVKVKDGWVYSILEEPKPIYSNSNFSYWDSINGITPAGLGSIVIIEPDKDNLYKPMNGLGQPISFDSGSFNAYSKISLKKSRKLVPEQQLRTKEDIANFLRENVFDKNELDLRESCYVIFADTQLRCLGTLRVAEGGIDSVSIDNRLIFGAAFTLGATRLIIAHNHPSGGVTPSKADIDYTKVLNVQCKGLGLQLIDHVIITSTKATSLAASGYI